jgi:hypothetical protein
MALDRNSWKALGLAPVPDGPWEIELRLMRDGKKVAVTPVTLSDLREFAEVDIEEGDPRYRKPLERDLRRLVRRLSPRCEVVLLGSVATDKYLSVLLDILPEWVRFPAEFVGRGDMSRGGLLLRCAVDGTELAYIPVQGAVRKGKRPPKLEPRRYLTR